MKTIKPGSRVCTSPFHVDDINLDVKAGDPLHVKEVDNATCTALVHFGGLLNSTVTFEGLNLCTREADVGELDRQLLHCQRCDKIKLDKGWMPKPPCFRPRPGVTLVPHNCPDCD